MLPESSAGVCTFIPIQILRVKVSMTEDMAAKNSSGMEVSCFEGVSTDFSKTSFRTQIFSCLFAENENQTKEKQVSHSSLSGLQPCRPCVRRPCSHVAQRPLAQVTQERGTRGVLIHGCTFRGIVEVFGKGLVHAGGEGKRSSTAGDCCCKAPPCPDRSLFYLVHTAAKMLWMMYSELNS